MPRSVRSRVVVSFLLTGSLVGSACAGLRTQRSDGGSLHSSVSTAAHSLRRVDVPLLDHMVLPSQILSRLGEARKTCDVRLSALASIPADQRTFDNTVLAFDVALADYVDAAQRLQILKDIHPDKDVRVAAAEAEETSSQYLVEVGARRDLYQAVLTYAEGIGKTVALAADQRRLLDTQLRDFKRNGLALTDAQLKRLVEIRRRLAELSTEFQSHLNGNTDSIIVSGAELDGTPESFRARLQKVDGGFVVTTKYPDVTPFMENAHSEDARRRLYVRFNTRESVSNGPILTEAVKLRDEAARLLGYATHADYVTEDRMAKTSKRVAGFLESVGMRMKARRDADYAALLELKKADTGKVDAVLQPWDVSYYFNQLKKKRFSIDEEEVREYFPADTVVAGMFGVYEQLLGVKIEPVEGASVWSPNVQQYNIRDAASGEIIAVFYADFYPREGKYGHAAVAPIAVPRESAEGYRIPVSVLMANFTPAAAGRPPLLAHAEVRTLFHEFGHVMHYSLTTARYAGQSGFNVAGDFVEAPSQMLENWVYEPAVLARLSGHWKDPQHKLPTDLVDRIRAARMYNAGYHYTRQVYLARFDQAIHTGGSAVDVDRTEHELFQSVLGLNPVSEVHFAASFGHLLGGYDAGYYGYLWSEVFAADMFTRFETAGVFDTSAGRAYRDIVLASGRSDDADALLERFLGRPASDAAFLHKLGGE